MDREMDTNVLSMYDRPECEPECVKATNANVYRNTFGYLLGNVTNTL